MVAIAIIAALLWHNRYSLLEQQVRQKFADMGIEAELDIVALDQHSAVVRDISFASNGTPILSISEAELSYELKQALNGQFQRIIIHRPAANLNLDAQGNIIDDWVSLLTSRNGEQNSVSLPSQGILIEDGQISWQAPFAHGTAEVSAEIQSLQSWNFNIDARDVVLTQNDVSLKLDIQGVAEQVSADVFTAIGTVSTTGVDTPALRTKAAKLDFSLSFAEAPAQKIDVAGWVHMAAAQLSSDAYTAESIKLNLDIKAGFDTAALQFDPSTFHWVLQGDDVAMRNADQRRTQAQTLTGYQAMSAAPIAQHFADGLSQKLDQLLAGFSVRGEGDFISMEDGYKIQLSDTFTAGNARQALHVSAPQKDIVHYSARTGILALSADLSWTGARPIDVYGLEIQGRSDNGIRFAEMRNLKGKIVSQAPWHLQKDGQSFRLAPFSFLLDYRQADGVRDVALTGAIDYDGLVPGGAVQGLRAGGILNMHMREDGFRIGIVPKGNIRMNMFTSGSGWLAKDVVFALEPSQTLMTEGQRVTEGQRGRALRMNLNHVRTHLIDPAGDRHLDIEIETLQADTRFMQGPTKWDIRMGNAQLLSDDFPAPGTKILSKSSALEIVMQEDGDISFISKNPQTRIETDNVLIPDIAIDIAGTPTYFSAHYVSDGVEFLGGDFPVLPMQGSAQFNAGALTGEAITTLPSSEDAPIHVAFRSVDGRGAVDINIPALMFSPRELQPQHLVASLRGKLADVNGMVSAAFHFSFGGGGPIRSYGTTDLIDLDIGTLVGPIQGINAQLKFSSIFPLKTDGIQTATLAEFDPGFPMENGTIRFEMIPNGVRIHEAVWPIENIDVPTGKLYMAPMDWQFGNVVNTAAIHIENVELGTLLAKVGKDKLLATGTISGVLPARIEGVNLRIEQGLLEIKDGGIIQFKSAASDAAATRNEYAGHGMKALENFKYKNMQMRMDGPLDGTINLDMVFEGSNPDVLNGQSFLYNLGVEGELANIARNLSKAFNTQETLEQILQIQTEQAD